MEAPMIMVMTGEVPIGIGRVIGPVIIAIIIGAVEAVERCDAEPAAAPAAILPVMAAPAAMAVGDEETATAMIMRFRRARGSEAECCGDCRRED